MHARPAADAKVRAAFDVAAARRELRGPRSAVRASRSAGRILSSRLGWVAALSAIVVLATSQLLFTLGYYEAYGDGFYAAALATITGQSLGLEAGLPRVLDVALLTYSVGAFAALAGTLGAYFFDAPRVERDRAAPSP